MQAKAETVHPTFAQSDAFSRSIMEAFPGFIYVCSRDYRIEFMNDHLKKRTGYDAVGLYCYRVLHELDSVCLWCVNDRVFAGEKVQWDVKSPRDGRWYNVTNVHVDGRIPQQQGTRGLPASRGASDDTGDRGAFEHERQDGRKPYREYEE